MKKTTEIYDTGVVKCKDEKGKVSFWQPDRVHENESGRLVIEYKQIKKQ